MFLSLYLSVLVCPGNCDKCSFDPVEQQVNCDECKAPFIKTQNSDGAIDCAGQLFIPQQLEYTKCYFNTEHNICRYYHHTMYMNAWIWRKLIKSWVFFLHGVEINSYKSNTFVNCFANIDHPISSIITQIKVILKIKTFYFSGNFKIIWSLSSGIKLRMT